MTYNAFTHRNKATRAAFSFMRMRCLLLLCVALCLFASTGNAQKPRAPKKSCRRAEKPFRAANSENSFTGGGVFGL